VAQLAGHTIAPLSVLGLYTSFVNVSFAVTTGISVVIGGYVLLATAVQMSMIDFWPANVDKEAEERRRLLRGIILVFFCTVMFFASWTLTRSAENVALGSPIMSEFFIGPLFIAALFYALVLTQWTKVAQLV
jgi:hypothetical protein